MRGGRTQSVQRSERVIALAAVLLGLSTAGAAWASAPGRPPAAPATATSASCTTADRLFDAGSISAARAAYEVAPGTACATSGLAAIRELVRLCDLGRSDLDGHRRSDALTAYKSALAKAPKARCAIAGVKSSGPDGFTRGLQWISTAVPNIPTVLAGIGLVFLIGLVLLAILGHIRLRSKRIPFERMPGLRTLLRPRIGLGTISDDGVQWTEGGPQWKVGASMTAQIKEGLQGFHQEALSDDSSDEDLDFGSTNDAIAAYVYSDAGLQTALDKVGEISESTKTVATLAQLVYMALPIRRLSVTGVLNPPSKAGASTTLSMESGARLVAAATLTSPLAEAEKPTCADYMRLVDQAAVWVQFEVTKELKGDRETIDDPDSYVCVREGVDRHYAQEPVEARAAFERALGLDDENLSAAIDLAVTEARVSGDYSRAIEILDRAIKDVQRTRPAARRRGG